MEPNRALSMPGSLFHTSEFEYGHALLKKYRALMQTRREGSQHLAIQPPHHAAQKHTSSHSPPKPSTNTKVGRSHNTHKPHLSERYKYHFVPTFQKSRPRASCLIWRFDSHWVPRTWERYVSNATQRSGTLPERSHELLGSAGEVWARRIFPLG